MRQINPVFPWDDLHQGLLDFFGRGLPGEVKAAGEALDVGVDDDAFRFPVGDAEDDAGGLAAAAGKLDEFSHRVRHLAGMLFGNGPATGTDGFGFVAEKASGFDEVFKFARWCFGKIGGGPVLGEEGGGDFVDADVGALGAENGGDEELERVFVVEFAADVGVGDAKFCDDFLGADC